MQAVTMERQSTEALRTFDPLASVTMLRYDLMQFGEILPETLDRVYDEELSYLTEGVDKAARTPFALRRDEDGTMLYFSRGEWRPYMGMLMTGSLTAEAEAEADPRKSFLAERARADLLRGYQMQSLLAGQRMSWYSPYPYEQAARYGDDFIRQQGFFPDRQMGFLYQAAAQEDGTIILESQTVDRSDEEAFAMALAGAEDSDMDTLVRRYDTVLHRKHGGHFYAGRRDSEMHENAWETITAQKQLVSYFLDGLESIARSELTGKDLEDTVKRHIYGVWAAFKKRIDGEGPAEEQKSVYGFSMDRMSIELEVHGAFDEFASLGRVLIGCGGTISMLQGEQNILNTDARDVFDAVFGSKSGEANAKLPPKIRCINCRERVASKDVVKANSWCCPSCKYEVDICNGKVLCAGNKQGKS